MNNFIVYSKLDFDRDKTYPPAFYGSPSSPEIQKIADALGADYTLGNGELCQQCSEYGLNRSSFDERSGHFESEDVLPIVGRDAFVLRCALCQLARRVL